MFSIILATHGNFATGLLEAGEMILGEQDNIEVLTLVPGESLEDFTNRLKEVVLRVEDKSNLLIITDLPGGTPFNAGSYMNLTYGTKGLSGINLPSFLQILMEREFKSVDILLKEIEEDFKSTIRIQLGGV